MSDSYENEISIEEKAKQEIELEAERKQLKKQIKKEVIACISLLKINNLILTLACFKKVID